VRCAALLFTLILSMPFSTAIAEEEMHQISCDLDNGFPSIALRRTSEMKAAGAHTFIVDFQEEGPVIRLPPEYYSPEWERVEEVTFQYIGNGRAEGRLSLKIRRRGSGTVYVQPVGVIGRTCWNALKGFLRRSKINRPIKEGIHVADPSRLDWGGAGRF